LRQHTLQELVAALRAGRRPHDGEGTGMKKVIERSRRVRRPLGCDGRQNCIFRQDSLPLCAVTGQHLGTAQLYCGLVPAFHKPTASKASKVTIALYANAQSKATASRLLKNQSRVGVR